MSDSEERIVREFPVELSMDGRNLHVRIVPYGKPTEVADDPRYGGTGVPYMEEWLPGVFDKQTNAANRVLVNFEHEPGIGGVVGSGRQLWDESDGAHGVFRMLSSQDADKALELVNDGVLTGVSVEAIPTKTVRENGVVKRVKARLKAIALCRMGAYEEAQVLAVREAPEPEPEPEPDPEPDPVPSLAEEMLARVGYESLLLRVITKRPWKGDPSRFEDDEYRRSCLICRAGEGTAKELCSLPVLEPNGDLNTNALSSAAAALSGARGGLRNVSAEEKARAARKLIRLYNQAEMPPPDSLRRVAAR